MMASFIPPKRILDAMARPTIGHLDPTFVDLMGYSARQKNVDTCLKSLKACLP